MYAYLAWGRRFILFIVTKMKHGAIPLYLIDQEVGVAKLGGLASKLLQNKPR